MHSFRQLLEEAGHGDIFASAEKREMPMAALDRWMDYLITGGVSGPSWSGERVSVKVARQLSVLYRCESLIAEVEGSLPLHIYRRGRDGSREVARENYLYPLVHDRVNPLTTAQGFREAMTRDALATGNGVALKEFDASGRVRNLWKMAAQRTEIFWDEQERTLVFRYHTEKSGHIDLQPSQVFHLAGPTHNGLIGYSVIQDYAANAIGSAIAARKFGAKFFANGARASGALSHPAKLTEAARSNLKKSTMEQIGGEGKLGLLILEEGMKFEQMSISPDDAQMLGTIDADDHDLCRWYGVPPILAGVTSKTTSWGSGIEHLNIFFLQYTKSPWLKRWEAAIQRDLIGWDNHSLYAEHDVAGLLRGDLKAQAAYLKTMVADTGIMEYNEGRAKLNLNPVPAGAMFARPMNTGYITPDGEPVEALQPKASAPAAPAPDVEDEPNPTEDDRDADAN